MCTTTEKKNITVNSSIIIVLVDHILHPVIRVGHIPRTKINIRLILVRVTY